MIIYNFSFFVILFDVVLTTLAVNISVDSIDKHYNSTTYPKNTTSLGSFRVYNKNSAQWKEVYYYKEKEPESATSHTRNEEDKDIPGHLKIGGKINGWGNVASPKECARECVTGAQPKICYYDWTVEYYRTLGGACDLCVPKTNSSITSDCQCIYGDGYHISGIITVNRMFPGPSIQVCLGDLVVVDVTNKAPGNEITIHWHGIYQINYQHHDGVPFVTQCPIQSGTSFRYQWRAQNIGTHWWHSHSGMQESKSLAGTIIIRQPKEHDPNHSLYDYDDNDNLIFLSDFLHDNPDDHFPGTSSKFNAGSIPKNILINGQGQWLNTTSGEFTETPLSVINVKPGKRYRFRMINGASFGCPLTFTIQNHNLTVIATDGESVKPIVVNSITSYSAERFDFIINANQQSGSYWIQARLIGPCTAREVMQLGILRYVGAFSMQPNLTRPTFNNSLPLGISLNEYNNVCEDKKFDIICMKNLEAAEPVDPRILAEKTDFQFYLAHEFHRWNENELFVPGEYDTFLTPDGGKRGYIPMIDGISNRFPTSPFLTQLNDIPKQQICNGNNKPKSCENKPVCGCSHVLKIPLNSSVEMVIINTDPMDSPHPFHMHGYGFHVMAQGSREVVNITRENSYEALKLDREIYKLDSYDRPPVKDTLTVTTKGYTIIRFIANNPGYWLLHCHIITHLMVGMSLTLHVGEDSDIPPTPVNFPTCGNYKPPILSIL
ncbi:laccase-5-like isoform X2 [Aphidius gifuensis]|uniref:laccase-5-like isoform X1 n=1 Tax=Aphidius gifuensis TaxID=684658 RepID=UPI001CDB61A7|nr:laccase-5-like isoform X1 [Aphidius gifuensis]XP_044007192.1 laccase-5-like isoform X2 [Aphidius gifuensis]